MFCNNEFTARTTVTKYCSDICSNHAYKQRIRQARIKDAEKEVSVKLNTNNKAIPKERGFLTVNQTAILLGTHRATIYRYLVASELKCLQVRGKTLIRRCDIDKLFDDADLYKIKPKIEHKPITEFYTISKIMEKYKVNKVWVYAMIKKHKIPKRTSEGKGLYSQKHVDKVFGHKIPNPNITEWYSVSEIQDRYDMTKTAIYSFVSEKNVPKKKEGRKVYYSKCHFDKARGADINIVDINYYTVEEAMAKYNLTKDSIYAYMRKYKIARIKEGRYVKISKPHLDEIFK